MTEASLNILGGIRHPPGRPPPSTPIRLSEKTKATLYEQRGLRLYRLDHFTWLKQREQDVFAAPAAKSCITAAG